MCPLEDLHADGCDVQDHKMVIHPPEAIMIAEAWHSLHCGSHFQTPGVQ